MSEQERPLTPPDDEPSDLEPGDRGTAPMTGNTAVETGANTPGGEIYPASPGTDSWEQADDTETTERATGN
jgi:hypothetical protein